MLEFFRKNVGGFMGFVIVGVLVFVFAMSFGTQSEGWGKGQTAFVAASVDGDDISETSFRIMLNLFGGRALARDSAEYASVQRAVIDGLVERQLLLGLADEVGISASDSEVEDRIVKNEFLVTQSVETIVEKETNPFFGPNPQRTARALLKDGYVMPEKFLTKDKTFDLEGFKKFVQYHLQATEELFIEEQRKELTAQRVREAIVAGVRVSAEEVRRDYDRENDTASISYLRLFPSYFANQLSPTADEIAAYAAANADAVRQYYDTNKYKYTNLEKQARARHILVQVPSEATDADRAAKRLIIDTLLARAKAGEDFAELARQYSEDPGSAAKGGDLGYNARGRMVPEFDAVMFALEPGKVSDVVQTEYGFHVIRLEGFREGNVPLEGATPEIAEQLYRESEGKKRAQTAANEYLARLKAGEPIESLIPAAPEGGEPGELGLKVRTSPELKRGVANVPGIGNAPEIVEAAFQLKAEAPIPDRVFELREDYFVIALKERKTPSDADFKLQEDEIAERILALKQATWLRAFVRELREKAEKEGRVESEMLVAAPAGEGAAEDLGVEEKGGDGAKEKDEAPAPAERAGDRADDDEGTKDNDPPREEAE
ncbi:MAG: peptidylprolyl isomerase [Proteobacteria bacterium]|jgi:peptidyl-prolyl cis-trans isomerase D|nr:peptidylprolyl isomerase [Pseudomonadota bacterium]